MNVRLGDPVIPGCTSFTSLSGVTYVRTSIYTELLVDIMRPAKITNLVIDKLDMALIDLLRQAARATYATMAATTGVSTGTVRTRVMRILAKGIFRIGLSWRPASQERVVRLGLGLRITGPATRLRNRWNEFRDAPSWRQASASTTSLPPFTVLTGHGAPCGQPDPGLA
ncbi:AsnC family transcriptional regulator [Pseudarthrobacter sp. lyk4-40-TYG-27]|uniref:AsnC family transcriptional regulator n=1 Tax=Pseudarthrobacter sp. lyk4-40-TYG-27 TaxID=3040305 RepID=UPI00255726AE|nr:AsnC family transcriptional regulator [Pseudarthrobacter sp. lyk4-40-TYG-27]